MEIPYDKDCAMSYAEITRDRVLQSGGICLNSLKGRSPMTSAGVAKRLFFNKFYGKYPVYTLTKAQDSYISIGSGARTRFLLRFHESLPRHGSRAPPPLWRPYPIHNLYQQSTPRRILWIREVHGEVYTTRTHSHTPTRYQEWDQDREVALCAPRNCARIDPIQ